jgi:hypothetical protein
MNIHSETRNNQEPEIESSDLTPGFVAFYLKSKREIRILKVPGRLIDAISSLKGNEE